MNEFFVARRECPCCGHGPGSELRRTPYCTSPIRDYLVSFYSPQGGVEFMFLQGQDYILIECSDCGLVYQKEIPKEFLMREIYESWIDPRKSFDLFERRRGIDYFARLSSDIARVIRFLNRPPMDLKLLDFSMGWGHWCRVAQSFGCAVDGTEFSREKLEYARSKGVHTIGYAEIADRQYDFINTEQVFEHLPEIRLTLRYLKDSLKPGGIVRLSVPNGWDIRQRLKKWDWNTSKESRDSLNPVAPLEHINCFDHSSLLALARDSGLVQVDTNPTAAGHRHSRSIMDKAEGILRRCWFGVKGFGSPPPTDLLFRSADSSHSSNNG